MDSVLAMLLGYLQLMRFLSPHPQQSQYTLHCWAISFSFVLLNLWPLLCQVHFQSCLGLLCLIDHSASSPVLWTLVVNFKSNFKELLLAVRLGNSLELLMVQGLFSDAAI